MKFLMSRQHPRTGLLAVGLAALCLAACGAKKEEPSEVCDVPKYVGAGTDPMITDFEDPAIVDETSVITNKDNLHVDFYSFGDNYDWEGPEDPVWTISNATPQGGSRYVVWTYKSACAVDPTIDLSFCYGATAVHFDGCYDASKYAGISIWVKGIARNATIELVTNSAQGTETGDGGSCPDNCTWQVHKAIALTDTWTLYEARFDGLLGGSDGTIPYPKDLASGIQVVAQPGDALDTDWEFDLDTVSFMTM